MESVQRNIRICSDSVQRGICSVTSTSVCELKEKKDQWLEKSQRMSLENKFSPNWNGFRVTVSRVLSLFLLQKQTKEDWIQLMEVHYTHNECMINYLSGF